jgi:hypothetical protein
MDCSGHEAGTPVAGFQETGDPTAIESIHAGHTQRENSSEPNGAGRCADASSGRRKQQRLTQSIERDCKQRTDRGDASGRQVYRSPNLV